MTDKEKPHTAGTGTASKTNESGNHITDPLQGWFNLAKPARIRQQTKAGKRGRK